MEANYVTVPLTQGKVAIVDAEDADRILPYKWHAQRRRNTFYAARSVRRDGGQHRLQFMHTFLTGFDLTDHINHDGLDNRRANLRSATNTQNQQNRPRAGHCSSGFKGVRRIGNRWYARITYDGRQRSLGSFASPEEAALAYDRAALAHHGEFACTNF